MLERSAAYEAAVTNSPRHIFLRAIVDISDPDKVWLPVTSSGEAAWSRSAELHDKDFSVSERYAALEPGRWLLGDGFELFPADFQVSGQAGYASGGLSGSGGKFSPPKWVSLNFEGMRVLQACSVFFSTDPLDGVPEDFTVEVMQGKTAVFTRAVTGNRETQMQFDGFTVYDPTAIRVTVTKWSLPGRRMRMVEILPGVYEDWDADMLSRFSVTQQGQFSYLALPYGTAEIAMDNHTRRFDPRRKDGIFQSIEERQGVELRVGVQLPGGGEEYMGIGMYYQAGDGWKSSENGMEQRWSLVDIIGLLAERTFLPPAELPTTLEGWLQALVGQLGDAFRRRYRVDPNYAGKPVTANSVEDVTGKKCGDILRWACQASGTWPRADQSTGALTAEPLWNQGQKITLDNLLGYPAMRDNESLAALIFRLSNGTELTIPGNSTSSEKTVTIINPFLHSVEQAQEAARLILAQYGGNLYETTGRGDPAGEIGDVDTLWLDESNAAAARRMGQTFEIQEGALVCRSRMLQADGSYLWTEYAVLDQEEGDWIAPPGVTDFRLVLSDGGQGGGMGQEGQKRSAGSSNISFSGYNTAYGAQGVDGKGGKVWFGTIKLNPGATVHYKRGAGGAPGNVYGEAGELGQPSVFGAYSSADGKLYPDGYTDIANGQAFCRPGVPVPLPGTGDGGQGGAGGDPPEGYLDTYTYTPIGAPSSVVNTVTKWVETKPAGPGHPGAAGASGFIMLTWEKPNTTI